MSRRTILSSLFILLICAIIVFIGFLVESRIRRESVRNVNGVESETCIMKDGNPKLTISYWKCTSKDNKLINIVTKYEGWIYWAKCTSKILEAKNVI